jgi:hypothetical protein
VKASDSYRIKLGACAALAGIALTGGIALAVGIGSPTSALPVLSDLGVGAEARANLAAASADAPPAPALEANRAAIEASPMTSAPWLRIAWLRSRSGPLDAEALNAIERSYTVEPYAGDVQSWRLTFLYDHWRELTPDIRALATAEHLAIVGYRPAQWTPDGVTDPAGRMAATFTHARALTIKAKTFAKKP